MCITCLNSKMRMPRGAPGAGLGWVQRGFQPGYGVTIQRARAGEAYPAGVHCGWGRNVSVRPLTFSVTVNTITVNTSVPNVQFPNICLGKTVQVISFLCTFFLFQIKSFRKYTSFFLRANTSNPKDISTEFSYYHITEDAAAPQSTAGRPCFPVASPTTSSLAR